MRGCGAGVVYHACDKLIISALDIIATLCKLSIALLFAMISLALTISYHI
jgi:hypothetical protein